MQTILVGAGALGRVLSDFISSRSNVKAFIDDSSLKVGNYENGIVVQSIDDIYKHDLSKTEFILSVFNPENRESFVKRITTIGGRFSSFFDDNFFISASASIGNGCVALSHTFIMNKACIGNYVHIHLNTIIGHDVVVGDYCSFGPNCIVGGFAHIGRNTFIGMGAQILPNVNIGDFSTIGAGAIVTKDIPSGATVIGKKAEIIVKGSSRIHFSGETF